MITLILWLLGLALIYWVVTLLPFVAAPFRKIILVVLICCAVYLVLHAFGIWDRMLSMPTPKV